MTLTRTDFARKARNRIRITPGTSLDPAAVDATGSNVNILVNAAAAMAEECESRSAARFAASLASTAQGQDLDRVVLEWSKGALPRKGAAAATIDLAVYRPTAAAGSGTVPAGTEILIDGRVWTLDASVVFGPTTLGGIGPTATCATLGTIGNGVVPEAHRFKDPGAIFDPSIVVESWGIPSSGGAERERDEDYRSRYAGWEAGLVVDVDRLAAGALAVPGVATAVAIEDLDADGVPFGQATLYIGDEQGRANSGLLTRVRVASRAFRAAGQRLRLFGTAPSFQPIVASFAIVDTYSVETVQAAARAALVAAVNKLDPGKPLQRAMLAAALKGVPGVSILESVPFGVTTPAADLAPTSVATTYRTRPELVTFA
jgi:uncharacterized phage protein gp47/JayE